MKTHLNIPITPWSRWMCAGTLLLGVAQAGHHLQAALKVPVYRVKVVDPELAQLGAPMWTASRVRPPICPTGSSGCINPITNWL